MNFWQALIMGLVQGVTEFLPVSSSAHLVLIPWFFKWEDPGLAYNVALHWGTLIAVVSYFRKDLVQLSKGGVGFLQGQREPINKLPWFIIAATIPGAILGLLFEHHAETSFRSPLLIAGTLSVMGVLLYLIDRNASKNKSIDQATLGQILLVGVLQGLAIVPGISRSGITITTALLLGFDRNASVRLSFLLSIPIIAGAGLLEIGYLLNNWGSPIFLLGIASAALSGLAAIHFLVTFVRTQSFTPFVIYRLALALLVVAFSFS